MTSTDIDNFTNANSDSKYDSSFVKKGSLPGPLDSLAFTSKPGTFFPPFQFDNSWYMAKLIALEERPDSMRASQILIGFEGTQLAQDQKITRSKDKAKKIADSLVAVLKKNPEKFTMLVRTVSDYPTAKQDSGDLNWFTDGNANFSLFFNEGLKMKLKDIKVVETNIGYSIFYLKEKTKPIQKARVAALQRQIEPSNQTYQDTYTRASAFAGQNKTQEAFDKAATDGKLQKRSAPGIKQMDNSVMGLSPARELVRWTFSENVKTGEVSPVFDMTGKFVVAILKNTTEKGPTPLDKLKERIEPNVRNFKKIEMTAEKTGKTFQSNKDLATFAKENNVRVDTTDIKFSGYGRTAIANEAEIVGKLFTLAKDQPLGPLTGNYGLYFVKIIDIIEPAKKEDFYMEKMQMQGAFSSRAGGAYNAIEKTAEINDNRALFF
jgi:hypothetical protein